MQDQILGGYLQDFQAQHGLENQSESSLFSRFVTYCVISKQTGNPASFEEFDVDDGQDTGLDAIAILVNDRVIHDKEDVDYFRNSGRLAVEFVFIQSKKSAKFDGGDIGKFLFGVKNFFSTSPTVSANESIQAYREIKDYLYAHSIHLKHPPTCRLFYASTGKWTNDAFLSGRIESDLIELRKTELFSEVKFSPIDAEKLKSTYRELRHRVEKSVQFEKHTILPKIDRAEEAYLGILPLDEFLKLITDEDGEIQKSLFYDNVRDFQGDNQVNSEIAETLKNPMTSGGFGILNNGVTIVAKSILKVGASFNVSDYQIVNGCQTSHVCHINRASIGPNVFVPIKLIVTSDAELANQIIKATNRQTEVKLEAFESLSPFHRTLEEFYASFAGDPLRRLYYERRSKQYANTPVKPTSIITLAGQAQSYLGMFLNEPHSTHRYYGEILQSYRDRLFVGSHSPHLYYSSGLSLSRIDEFFRNGDLPKRFKRFKHHLLLLFRVAVSKRNVVQLQGKAAEELSLKINELLWNRETALIQFSEAVDVLKGKLESFEGGNAEYRQRAFTNHLIPGEHDRPRGRVKHWNPTRGFGFVTTTNGEDVFVHYTQIRETLNKSLREGDSVEFDIVHDERGLQARNLRVLQTN